MKSFINNLSTRAKLILAFAALWVLLAVVIAIAYVSITEITQSEKVLRDVHFEIALQLTGIRSNLNHNRADILTMMLTSDRSDQEAIEKEIEDCAQTMDAAIAELIPLDPDPECQANFQEMKNLLGEYRQIRAQEITLIYAGKLEEVDQLAIGVGAENFEKIRSLTYQMSENEINGLDTQLAQDQQAAQSSIRLFAIFGVIALVLAVVLVVVLNQTIASPLTGISKIAEQIGGGDLSVNLPADQRRDEIGVLMQTFSRMTQSLQAMVGVAERIAAGDLRGEVKPQSEKDVLGNALARMVENLRRMTVDISQAVGLLGSSASEILASTTQIASGTAESATAINETTTTVEQVRQAAQLSSQKAQYVSDSAQRVAQVSQSGQKAVEETAAGMDRIREQMETIAQTVVRLSEQSQSIGGIIAAVNDLADQSNLLAVNAAIEAAKAGEQGKGFAVVAQEIKSLAEQSKQATAQVRDILSDVQKATSAAVMATEQGSKAVDAGVKQSAQAGEAIRVLAETSGEAAQAATQIVASSRQQVVGMDQIGIAMENINQAESQNATSMNQMEIAAQNLHELGQKLKELVEQFKT